MTRSKSEIFHAAWSRAREAAEFFGGSSKSYFAESLRQEQQREYHPENIDPENVVVPNDQLPVITYYQYKAKFGVPPDGSDTFWVKAKDFGKGDWDSIDLKEARNWEDGSDNRTVEEVAAKFAPPGSEFIPQLGGFVWSAAYDAYISGGGTDAELSQFFGF